MQKNLVSIESELSDLEKKQARYEEKEELVTKLDLKDGKCPVCDSIVDHLNPDFQKEHIENEIEVIEKKIEELENERKSLLEKSESLSDDLEESKEAATILRTHKITNESQLEDCLLYTSPSPRDGLLSRMPSSA